MVYSEEQIKWTNYLPDGSTDSGSGFT